MLTNKECILNFAGMQFRGLKKSNLFPEPGKFKFIVTANADFVVLSAKNERFRNLVSNNYSTFDGQITFWLAKLLGCPKGLEIEKISGSSFVYDLIGVAKEENLKVFLLGASPDVNKSVAEIISKKYSVAVQGYSPDISAYPFAKSWNDDILAKISEFSPDMIFVALGTPKQEYWIEENQEALKAMGIKLAMGCGGTLDFISGRVPRAPVWVQRIGMEGVFRLVVEPRWFRLKRLARSLLVFPVVIYKSLLQYSK